MGHLPDPDASPPPPSPATPELGRLGPYRLTEVLGRGGMSIVFKAQDPSLERSVAVKVLSVRLLTDDLARQRFRREAEALASLRHERIVPIYHVGEDCGVPYLAMPLLQGETLHDRLRREGRLHPAEALRIGRQVAEGLAAAHDHHLIHRDIKPANIWLEAGGAAVRICDFGLALAVADRTDTTRAGVVVGTPAYMAPEQARGRPVDGRCDLFGLGCVLYHALTGELPFRGSSSFELLRAVLEQDPPPPHVVAPEVPPAVSGLVLKLLAKRPEDRLASARDVVAAVDQLLRAHGPVPPAGPPPRGKRIAAMEAPEGEGMESVAQWPAQLRAGEPRAVQIWGRYFRRLVALARNFLWGPVRRVADEEDLLQSVFCSFYRRLERGEFAPGSQEEVWRLLVHITRCRASNLVRRAHVQKRGVTRTATETDMYEAGERAAPLDQVVGPELAPDRAAEAAETFQAMLDCLEPELRTVVLLKMEGYSNEEIARKLGCVERTIARRLRRIRDIWSEQRDGPA